MVLIGLTGTNGSGKGTIVDYLVKEKGFWHFSVSGHLEKILDRNGIDTDRDNLTYWASRLRHENGDAAYLVRNVYDQVKSRGFDSKGDMIIESIRNPAEIDFLRKEVPEPAFFAFVDAPLVERYNRAIDRGTNKDDVHPLDFLRHYVEEMYSGDFYGLRVGACKKKADLHVDTNCSQGEVYRQSDKLVEYAKDFEKSALRNI